MFALPFDIADPPTEPPDGSDRLLWIVAHELAEAHKNEIDGSCAVCRPPARWECDPHKLATAALIVAASGFPVPTAVRGRLDKLVTFLTANLAKDECSAFESGYRAACEDVLDLATS